MKFSEWFWVGFNVLMAVYNFHTAMVNYCAGSYWLASSSLASGLFVLVVLPLYIRSCQRLAEVKQMYRLIHKNGGES